jgi:hypothetical protein
LSLGDSICKATNYCISNGHLEIYLQKNGTEDEDMFAYQMSNEQLQRKIDDLTKNEQGLTIKNQILTQENQGLTQENALLKNYLLKRGISKSELEAEGFKWN